MHHSVKILQGPKETTLHAWETELEGEPNENAGIPQK